MSLPYSSSTLRLFSFMLGVSIPFSVVKSFDDEGEVADVLEPLELARRLGNLLLEERATFGSLRSVSMSRLPISFVCAHSFTASTFATTRATLNGLLSP